MNIDKGSAKKDYFEAVSHALLQFQFIEETLRIYISYCYEIIERQVSNYIPFKYTYKDLRKDALGILLQKFEKYKDNKELILKIKKLIQERNYCAHNAFMLSHEIENCTSSLRSEIEKIEKISSETKERASELYKELQIIVKINHSLKQK